MRIWAIVPVKRLAAGKSRLTTILTLRERRALVCSVLVHTLEELNLAGGIEGILVVGKDSAVSKIARAAGASFVREAEHDGLNRALKRGVGKAERYGADAVLILPADLASLKAADISWVLKQAGRPPFFMIAPDRAKRGTNLIWMAPPELIRFSFGERSFQRHLNAARQSGVKAVILRRPALAHDIDRPEDLVNIKKRDGYF